MGPGYEKLRAIAKAMGFAVEEWFEAGGVICLGSPEEIDTVEERVRNLFETVNNPSTGVPFTVAEVACMSGGDHSKEEAEYLRSGAIPDPTVSPVMAMAEVFGVDPPTWWGTRRCRSWTEKRSRL